MQQSAGPINVLLVGGGGREHSLAWKLKQSPRLGKLWITHPENPGLAALGAPVDEPIEAKQAFRSKRFCEKNDIGLVVIGPEDPLAEGLADALQGEGRVVFGPTKDAARLEWDKSWSKEIMRAASVPCADGRSFTDPEGARQYVETRAYDDQNFRQLLSRFGRVGHINTRRRYIDAALRIGKAKLTGQPGGRQDLEYVGESKAFAPDEPQSVVISECARLAAAWSTQRTNLPVIKAAGLAKGKGVVLPSTIQEAHEAIDAIMIKKVFGDAGQTVVIEERLEGHEASVLALVDGRNIFVLDPCQDHKRLGDNDTGPNTGGMGAYSPGGITDEATLASVERDILVPIIDTLRREGVEFRGVLYAGLMITPGGPKVLEFNTRFGDPECQSLMVRMKADLVEVLLAAGQKRLHEVDIRWDPPASCCIVLASRGYPEKPETGKVIEGIDEANAIPNTVVFHAGTARDERGRIVTKGGRVLNVVSTGANVAEARRQAYRACELIRFEGKTYRTDIGARA
jgi:phosphoribosylamine--glycine ligase